MQSREQPLLTSKVAVIWLKQVFEPNSWEQVVDVTGVSPPQSVHVLHGAVYVPTKSLQLAPSQSKQSSLLVHVFSDKSEIHPRVIIPPKIGSLIK